jgi:flagellar biosynthetic protein FliO
MLFLRMGVSLGIILGMIWMAAKVVRRRGVPRAADSTSLEVVGRRSVGRRSNLLVVKAGERTLLVGCTESQVSLVADLTDGTSPVPLEATEIAPVELSLVNGGSSQPVAIGGPRVTLLDSIRDLTVRRT